MDGIFYLILCVELLPSAIIAIGIFSNAKWLEKELFKHRWIVFILTLLTIILLLIITMYLIEYFNPGEEYSLMVLTNGIELLPLSCIVSLFVCRNLRH